MLTFIRDETNISSRVNTHTKFLAGLLRVRPEQHAARTLASANPERGACCSGRLFWSIDVATYKYPRTVLGKVTPTYRSYRDMLNRCYYEKHNRYPRYGGRGITVCSRWLESFDNFMDDMGARPTGLQLDRKDNDGHYEPDNCRWATSSEQALNRSTTRKITHNGVTKSIREWSGDTGIPYSTLERRINSGLKSVSDALTSTVKGWPAAKTFNIQAGDS
jgi:hypothetical protein